MATHKGGNNSWLKFGCEFRNVTAINFTVLKTKPLTSVSFNSFEELYQDSKVKLLLIYRETPLILI